MLKARFDERWCHAAMATSDTLGSIFFPEFCFPINLGKITRFGCYTMNIKKVLDG